MFWVTYFLFFDFRDPTRVSNKYGQRELKYIFTEVGHAAQNVCLQAVSLELGTEVIGAFSDRNLVKILKLPENDLPVYIMPIGR